MQLQSYSSYLAAELRDNPPRQKGQRTRARLLLAAAQVLEERGFHAMRVGDITAQAEVAEGSFYVYFKDKTEISVEALARFFDDYVAKAMTPASGDTPFARIRSTNRLWFRVCRANPGLMKCVFQVGDYVPEFLQISQKINRRWAEVVAESIQRRRAEDDPDAVRLAGYMLVAIAQDQERDNLQIIASNWIYDAIEAAGYPQPAVIPFNLETALPHQYDELAAMIEREFGKLDGLLLNASIVGPRTPLEQLSGDNFMRVMQVNVNATFMLTSALLPLLKLSSDASVVFTSSSVGRKGRAYWGAYAVSKFATEGLMQVLADEVDGVAPVRANSINPGATRTDMRAQAYPGENPASNPLPEAIMPVYLYLMGPDSSGVNGQAFDAQ